MALTGRGGHARAPPGLWLVEAGPYELLGSSGSGDVLAGA